MLTGLPVVMLRRTTSLRPSGGSTQMEPWPTVACRPQNPAFRFLGKCVLSPIAPHIKYWSNPKTAARVITKVLTDDTNQTGVYYDEKGRPMLGSAQVRDPAFQDRFVAETRALLATVPTGLRSP